MVVVVEYIITMHVDKFRSLFLSKNTLVSQWTKHIDVRHHFIRDYVEDGTLHNSFFRSEENISVPFTRNLSNGPLELLTSRYVHCE